MDSVTGYPSGCPGWICWSWPRGHGLCAACGFGNGCKGLGGCQDNSVQELAERSESSTFFSSSGFFRLCIMETSVMAIKTVDRGTPGAGTRCHLLRLTASKHPLEMPQDQAQMNRKQSLPESKFTRMVRCYRSWLSRKLQECFLFSQPKPRDWLLILEKSREEHKPFVDPDQVTSTNGQS